MSADDLAREFGAEAFGADPAGYDEARPEYPAWVFDRLAETCGLVPGAAVFEIGAGTGIATRALLARGAGRVVAIEPDARLGAFLRARAPDPRLEILPARFDGTLLPGASFDLGVCATAFHWLEEDDALQEIAAALKPGGWWSAVWHVFGDPERHDAFHEATRDVFEGRPRSPSDRDSIPYALDVAARTGALVRSGRFDAVTHYRADWSLTLTAAEMVRLYATYSNVQARPDRAELLAALHQIARAEFDDRVVRNMTTILYCAQRRGA